MADEGDDFRQVHVENGWVFLGSKAETMSCKLKLCHVHMSLNDPQFLDVFSVIIRRFAHIYQPFLAQHCTFSIF